VTFATRKLRGVDPGGIWPFRCADFGGNYLAVGSNEKAAFGTDVGVLRLVALDAVRLVVASYVALLGQRLMTVDAPKRTLRQRRRHSGDRRLHCDVTASVLRMRAR